MAGTITPKILAKKMGIPDRKLRAFLREIHWRAIELKYKHYYFTEAETAEIERLYQIKNSRRKNLKIAGIG